MSATQFTSSDVPSTAGAYRPPHRGQCMVLLAAFAILTFFFAGNVWASDPSRLLLSAAVVFWGVVSLAAIGIAVGLWTGQLQPDDP